MSAVLLSDSYLYDTRQCDEAQFGVVVTSAVCNATNHSNICHSNAYRQKDTGETISHAMPWSSWNTNQVGQKPTPYVEPGSRDQRSQGFLHSEA